MQVQSSHAVRAADSFLLIVTAARLTSRATCAFVIRRLPSRPTVPTAQAPPRTLVSALDDAIESISDADHTSAGAVSSREEPLERS